MALSPEHKRAISLAVKAGHARGREMRLRWAEELRGKTVVFTHDLSGPTFRVAGITERGKVKLEGRAGLFDPGGLVEAEAD